ncbi:DNA -binding domain-containing protein [Sphingosinicella rhizophila]|uniref:DUF2285 domain-containing protein n=1 Tax=Sphingosinicella rhizophila TaxID=3050082 RepID=A0ABU3Q5C9_9SPHN|nr:DUF2285 domain-containing protein [Sphingosinicella sp. GR2756]MDT9598612.1 DUF2285 domain-containing protein [Sphingosinicella sp. GR2756]
MWTADADPHVLRVRVSPPVGAGSRSIDLLTLPGCMLRYDDRTHVRLDLTDGVLRLDVIGRSMVAGEVTIEPAIDLARSIDPQIASLRRLDALLRGDLRPFVDQRFIRLVEALRVRDALADGASLRDIGLAMYGGDWPGDGEHSKSRVRRRIVLAERLIRAGPRAALTGRI